MHGNNVMVDNAGKRTLIDFGCTAFNLAKIEIGEKIRVFKLKKFGVENHSLAFLIFNIINSYHFPILIQRCNNQLVAFNKALVENELEVQNNNQTDITLHKQNIDELHALIAQKHKEIQTMTQKLQEVYDINKITQVYNQNKVEFFKDLAARALALGIPEEEIKQTMQAIQANFEMIKGFCSEENVIKFQAIATIPEVESQESDEDYNNIRDSQFLEITNLWTETQKEVNKKGDSIRSR